MPRDGSGVYSKAQASFVAATTIASAAVNSDIDDLVTDLNTPRPLTAGGTGGASQIAGWDGITAKGTDIASASTINLTTATGPRIDITGTTTVTAVTLANGSWRIARATGAFQFTASATLLVNKSAAVNYTTTAGDLLIFTAEGGITSVTSVGSVAAATTSASGIVNLTQLGIAYNASLAAAVGASALTVSLKGADGNDPSATNPVVIPFRNATLATGTPVLRTVTAATSVVVASTKTMGTSSGVAFRLWVVAVDTGSGIELGLVNALSGTSIMALLSSQLYSPTATPANAAQVIYTTSGQTSKPICVLGYLDFSSGEATAGTWATAPDRVQVRTLGTKLPGDVVQIVRNDTGASATGTTQIPGDNTFPQNTEGDQYMSQAITPLAAPNVLRVIDSGVLFCNAAATSVIIAALFRDSVANAVAATWNQIATSGSIWVLTHSYEALAGSVSATTFKYRAGANAAGTTTFNGSAGSQTLGGVMNSFMQIEEIMA